MSEDLVRRVFDAFNAHDPDAWAALMTPDGTFQSADEIPGRSIAEIPHPLVSETASLVAGMPQARGRVYLVHLNHTNRLLWDENAKAALAERGVGVAKEGQRIPLAGSGSG